MAVRFDPCDPRRLDLLLRQCLAGPDQRQLENHLHACRSCRDKLDEMAGGSRWWTDIRRYLQTDGTDDALSTAQPKPASATKPVDLHFLQASMNPSSLGRLEHYEVFEVLGHGGMGIVLKGFDAALNRPVAIKVLAAELSANGAARKRFAREAQAAAAVIHDHVVSVYAVDANAVPPYLVMAFITGQSLQQRLDQSGPLELKEILRIGMQTASGLAAAHAQGLVHRDIKPANIMLENGIERVRITDFGLARAVDDASISQSGAVAGTPQYMAPEQAAGAAVDQRADLFSLGSTLYAMCTGRPPFRGDSTLAIIRQVCDCDPVPVRSINPDIPVWLEGIVRMLQAKEPSERLGPAQKVADLLEGCLAHVQQPDHPLPRLAQDLVCRHATAARHYARRSRVLLFAAVASASVAAAIWLDFIDRPIGEGPGMSGMESTNLSQIVDVPTDLTGLEDNLWRKVGSFRESLSGGSSMDSSLAESLAQELTTRVRHAFADTSDAGRDAIDGRFRDIRQRIERLRAQTGGSDNE
jgi:eukaryotic-like serine/threonine-protein kinase